MDKKIIRKVGLAVFKNQQVLMVQTEFGKDAYYFLGGKIEAGESDLDCLLREVKEEADAEVDQNSLTFLGEFEAAAHGRENTVVIMRLYQGQLTTQPKPSSEVIGIVYCDSSLALEHHTELSTKVFAFLKEKNLIC